MKTLYLSIITISVTSVLFAFSILAQIDITDSQLSKQECMGGPYCEGAMPPSASVGNRTVEVALKLYSNATMPNNVHYIWMRFFDANTNQTLQHVSFFLTINDTLMRDTFHTHTGIITLQINSTDMPFNGTVIGDREPILNAWTPHNNNQPVIVYAPVFNDTNSTYNLKIIMDSIDSDNNLFSDQSTAPRFNFYLNTKDNQVSLNSTNYGVIQDFKKVQLWAYNPPSDPGPLAVSSNGSYVTVGTRQDDNQGSVYLLDNNGIVLWNHLLTGYVRSVGMSPDGKFVEATTIQLLNNGGIDYGYHAWFANPDLYIFDNSGQTILEHKIDDSIGMLSSSQDGSLVATSNGNGVLYSNSLGKALWGYNIGNVTSVSVSPDGSFVSACTGNKIISLDKQGNLLWNYKTNGTGFCPNIATSNLGYVVAGQGLTVDMGEVYLLDKNGVLLWKNSKSSTYPFGNVTSSNGQYEVETTGNSDQGYGLTVLFNKLEYSTVPEFPFAVPVLLIGIISLIVFYRIRFGQ